jgi:phosphopantothenoylcysteine decarboxylase/phosphopantothenate--cysteine ligase
VTVIRVQTAQEMFDSVMAHADQKTVIIKAAAVSDWRPERVFQHKLKKADVEPPVYLEKTVDILQVLGEKKKAQILVGFAAETQDLQRNARAKLVAKKLDLIVANAVGQHDSGFGSDMNQVALFYADGRSEAIPLMDKGSLADIVLDRVLEIKKALQA